VDSAKGHDCELLPVTAAAGVYSSQRHGVPSPLHGHWQNVETSSLFKRGAINKRPMDKWKCHLQTWAEQAGSSRAGQPRAGAEPSGAAGLAEAASPGEGERGLQLRGEEEDSRGRKTTCF